MRIKICGITTQEDINLINRFMPDYAGFIFAESKREVTKEQAAALIKNLSPGIKPVGVFVHSTEGEIALIAEECGLYAIQFHGPYSEEFIANVTAYTKCVSIKCIKTHSINSVKAALDTRADYILFDTYDKNAEGGTGRNADWAIINAVKEHIKKPFFLAGGINADNAGVAAALEPYALDVCSGVEADGGGKIRKDEEKISALFRAVG